ncbi:MAG: hypothetical protein MUP11_03620, partial [Anaerolineales bacterium]|nr:hypothetical protein [Anaerolineales bacterium]
PGWTACLKGVAVGISSCSVGTGIVAVGMSGVLDFDWYGLFGGAMVRVDKGAGVEPAEQPDKNSNIPTRRTPFLVMWSIIPSLVWEDRLCYTLFMPPIQDRNQDGRR